MPKSRTQWLELVAANDIFQDGGLKTTEQLWLGMDDTDMDGTWMWYDRSGDVTWTNWMTGQPSNTGGVENCVGWYVKQQPAGWAEYNKWNDRPCDKRISYVCQCK